MKPEEQKAKYPTREAWLEAAVRPLADKVCLPESSYPRVSVGFPSKGATSRRKRRIGECWHPKAAEDGRSQVYISPLEADPVRVLDVLLHELGHVKHPDAKHGKEFKRYMKLAGLEGPATATIAGAQCSLWLAKVAENLGPYPHVKLNPADIGVKKQTTRLLKATCPACECTVRITAKWAGEVGETLPFCGYCGIPGNPDSFERMKLDVSK